MPKKYVVYWKSLLYPMYMEICICKSEEEAIQKCKENNPPVNYILCRYKAIKQRIRREENVDGMGNVKYGYSNQGTKRIKERR